MSDEIIAAAFITKAICESDKVFGRIDPDVHGGEIGLVNNLAPLIELANARSDLIAAEHDHNYPGVLAYEVYEPFGAWIAKHILEHAGELPDLKLARTWLDNSLRAFFEQ